MHLRRQSNNTLAASILLQKRNAAESAFMSGQMLVIEIDYPWLEDRLRPDCSHTKQLMSAIS